ncbi:MAG: hypothetical protein C4547_16135 [Phycisphaerales bacterium]|nr:MAG: hypothetical protein C4547_16135 [Phycisphaerales bacterium]
MDRLNVIFAVSAALMLVSFLWFIAVDHDLPWRDYQSDFMSAQSGLSYLDYVATRTDEVQQQIDAAAARLEEARSLVHSRRGTIQRLREELIALKAEYDDVKLRHSSAEQVLQVLQQRFEEVLAEHGEEEPRTQKARQELEEERNHVARLRLRKEQLEDEQRAKEAKINEATAPETEALKAYNTLMRQREEALARSEDFRRQLVFNIPLADFAAPFSTPGRQEIKQIVLPDVRQPLNYLQSYTIDRCTTCHTGIDNKALTRQALVRRFEEAIPAINDYLADRGAAPLDPVEAPTLAGNDAPRLTSGNVSRHWDLLDARQKSAYYSALLTRINGFLEREGLDPIVLDQPLLGHPDLELFVHVDSPHPMAKMGCTVCHEGNPHETDFVLAAHSPPDHETQKEWEREHYVRVLGIPTATFELVEHYWDRHMLPLKYTEGSCVKCHTDPNGIGQFAGEPRGRVIQRGQNLFTRAGCINCHLVEGMGDHRRVGPDLAHVATKLEPGFTQQWIYNPRQFRPSTWMPHFFMQENNGPGSENQYDPHPVLRTQTEVAAMTEYLFAFSTVWQQEPLPAGLTGDAERGRDLFKTVGCLGCHASLAEYGEEWIQADLRHDGKTPAQAQADYDAMTYNERVKYALEHFPSDRDTVFDPDPIRFDPQREYNPPVFTRIGPELSAVGTKTTVEWLYAWLRDPSAYSADTRMPGLRLSEQEALDLAAYLAGLKHDEPNFEPFPADEAQARAVYDEAFDILSAQRSEARSRAVLEDQDGELTRMIEALFARSDAEARARAGERIAAMSLEEKRMVFLGSKAIAHYGCYACHNIPGFENAVRPGTELTTWAQKPISQLDFGFFGHGTEELREQPHNKELFARLYPPHREDLIELARGHNPEEQVNTTHAGFAYHKMRNPRIWDRKKLKKPFDKLKMPNFYFLQEEADALVTFLMGRTAPRVNHNLQVEYDDARSAIAAGRGLIRDLNCIACHQIEDNVATVQQYFRVSEVGRLRFDEDNAPPNLRGEGAKIQHNWFFEFLNHVEPLRPWLKVRMPSFNLTPRETTTIVEYFAGLAQEDARHLSRQLKPINEFIEAQAAAGTAFEADGREMPPGHGWFLEPSLEEETDLLAKYAVTNRLSRAFELDPAQNTAAQLADKFHSVLKDVSFLRELYDVRYPFVDAPRPFVSDDHFQRGEQLLLELGCLKCHVLGDPSIDGANKSPTAPNLNLAYRRLQQDWIRRWLKAPSVIQPGTKMPGLFPERGTLSAFADFGEARAELEARYGATAADQIELILDYLYHAGLRNHTAIDPKVAAAQQAQPAAGDEEFFEEEEEFFEDDG